MVAYQTLLLTDKGHIPIGTLENQEVNVWNGEEFVSTVVIKTRTNAPLRTLALDSGAEIELHPDHNIHIQNAYWKHTITTEKVSEQEPGKKLLKGKFPILQMGTKTFPYAYTHGFYMGVEKYHRLRKNVVSRTATYGMRRPAISYLELDPKTDKTNLYFPEDMPDIYEVPLSTEYSLETKLEWLAGLFDGGLTKRANREQPIWHIYSKSEGFLRDLKLMFQTLGGDARVIKNQDMERDPYSIRLSGVTMQNIRKFNIQMNNHVIPEINYYRRGFQMPRIVSVLDEGAVGDTYGFIEPNRRSAIFNGILLGDGYTT
jgi:ribonucleoside-diphosphate reductase alpha chain